MAYLIYARHRDNIIRRIMGDFVVNIEMPAAAFPLTFSYSHSRMTKDILDEMRFRVVPHTD